MAESCKTMLDMWDYSREGNKTVLQLIKYGKHVTHFLNCLEKFGKPCIFQEGALGAFTLKFLEYE